MAKGCPSNPSKSGHLLCSKGRVTPRNSCLGLQEPSRNKGFPCGSAGKKSTCNAGDPGSIPWIRKICWSRDRLHAPVFLGFPCDLAGKESACNAGDLGSISGLGRSPGEGEGYSLQYSDLENSMDCIVHGVAKSRTQLRDFHFHVQRKTVKVIHKEHTKL